MVEAWDDTAKVSFDKAMWAALTTSRFAEDAANALVLGPVGAGKTFLASALGHIPAGGASRSTSSEPTVSTSD